MTSFERAAMLGRLAEAKDAEAKARLKCEALCRTIRMELNAMLKPVDQMDIPGTGEMWDDLAVTYAELLTAKQDRERLEREL